jgi:hypothetical protein
LNALEKVILKSKGGGPKMRQSRLMGPPLPFVRVYGFSVAFGAMNASWKN